MFGYERANSATASGSPTARDTTHTPMPSFLLDHGRFATFDVPAACMGTSASGINDKGHIVGKYNDGTTPGGAGAREHGFLRTDDGRFTTFDLPGVRSTSPLGINDRGHIVGVYSHTSGRVGDDPNRRGFLLDGGKLTKIDVPGAEYTQAFDVNNRGQVVGEYLDADGYHGFLWEHGDFTRLDFIEPGLTETEFATSALGINERGQIVGIAIPLGDPMTIRGYVRDQGVYSIIKAPKKPLTAAFGINDRSQIVGAMSDSTLPSGHGFLLADRHMAEFTPLGVPGATGTVALGVNNRGQMVGFYTTREEVMPQRYR